jgi:hypothetical protein
MRQILLRLVKIIPSRRGLHLSIEYFDSVYDAQEHHILCHAQPQLTNHRQIFFFKNNIKKNQFLYATNARLDLGH